MLLIKNTKNLKTNFVAQLAGGLGLSPASGGKFVVGQKIAGQRCKLN